VTLGIGQLYVRGIRLPADGAGGTVFECLNQLVIFAPIVLLPIIRGHALTTMWLRIDRLWARLLIGLGLAFAALAVFSFAFEGAATWGSLVREIYQPHHADLAVQVLLEDLTIAILFVRLEAVLRRRTWAVLAVAALFAAGHIPAMIAGGASLGELLLLLRDFGLAAAVLAIVSRARDVVPFWCVHYALDMTQFAQ